MTKAHKISPATQRLIDALDTHDTAVALKAELDRRWAVVLDAREACSVAPGEWTDNCLTAAWNAYARLAGLPQAVEG